MTRALAAVPALLLAAATAAAAAASTAPVAVNIRAGQHAGFGRLVLDLPPGVTAQQRVDGERIVLSFSGPVTLHAPSDLPRNFARFDPEGIDGAVLRLTAGARAEAKRIVSRLVIDARDPPRAQRAPALMLETIAPTLADRPPIAAAPPPAAQSVPVTESARPGLAGPALPSPAVPEPHVSPASAAPSPLAVRRVALPDGQDGAAIELPFEAGVGAAAFARAGALLVIFDTAKPLDLSALRDDAVWGGASVQVLPSGTLLRLRPPPGWGAALTAGGLTWRLTLAPSPAAPRPIAAREEGGGLRLAVTQPGRVVAVPDPASGAILLAGTVRGTAEATGEERQTPEFALLRTVAGVAVEPLSDRVQLAVAHQGFLLSAASGRLALSPGGTPLALAAQAARLTRRFDLPALPEQVLRRRMAQERAAAAQAPPLARGAARIKLARTMLALGLGEEAGGVLRAAAAGDPSLADDPELIGLQALAAVLAVHPEEAEGLSDPRLSGTDEVVLWRGLRNAEAGRGTQAAAAIARAAPLLLEAPRAVRDAMLPLGLETMIAAGATEPAASVLEAWPDDPRLALARAMAAERKGDTDAALAAYDAIAAGPDRLAHFRAAMRAIDLRLARHLVTPAQAIEALERLDAGWRGDRYELARRERLAELRAATGDWRGALNDLRETAALFPQAAPELRVRMQQTMSGLLAQDAAHGLPPLEFVALMTENADALGAALTEPDLQGRLADRLLALDLPDAAVPILRRLVAGAPAGAGRAGMGARLASVLLAGGDAAGAAAALADSAADPLPVELAARRTMLAARAAALRGDAKGAAAMMAGLSGDEADTVRADIAEQGGDYAAATAALAALLTRQDGGSGTLPADMERTVLRLATDATRAGRSEVLADLRARMVSRLGKGADADTIRLLLAAPLRQSADIARASGETALAGAVAARLNTSDQPR